MSKTTQRQAHALEKVAQSSRFVRETTRTRDKDIRVAVKLGLSLREVARVAGIGHMTVARIVNGGRNA